MDTSQQLVIDAQFSYLYLRSGAESHGIWYRNTVPLRKTSVLSLQPDDITCPVLCRMLCQQDLIVVDFQIAFIKPDLYFFTAVLPWYSIADTVKAYQALSCNGSRLPAVPSFSHRLQYSVHNSVKFTPGRANSLWM